MKLLHKSKQMANLNENICNHCGETYSLVYKDKHGYNSILKTVFCSKSCAVSHKRGKTTSEIKHQAISFIKDQGVYCTTGELCKGINTSSKTIVKHNLKISDLNAEAGMFKPKSKFQDEVGQVLFKNFEHVELEKTFDGLTGVKGHPLRVDFYIPEINTVVEADGSQHKDPKHPWREWDNGTVQQYDEIKNKYFLENGIKVVRIPYKRKIKDSDILSGLD